MNYKHRRKSCPTCKPRKPPKPKSGNHPNFIMKWVNRLRGFRHLENRLIYEIDARQFMEQEKNEEIDKLEAERDHYKLRSDYYANLLNDSEKN